jgi:hypothetical protein
VKLFFIWIFFYHFVIFSDFVSTEMLSLIFWHKICRRCHFFWLKVGVKIKWIYVGRRSVIFLWLNDGLYKWHNVGVDAQKITQCWAGINTFFSKFMSAFQNNKMTQGRPTLCHFFWTQSRFLLCFCLSYEVKFENQCFLQFFDWFEKNVQSY